MRARVIEHFKRNASAEQLERMRALVSAGSGGNLVEGLLAMGFPAKAVLEVCADVSGIPLAPAAWLREPRPDPRVDGDLCRKLGCAPVADLGGLCIAYADPEIALASESHALPAHRPYLALAAHLKRAIELLPAPKPKPAAALVAPPPMRPPPKAPAAPAAGAAPAPAPSKRVEASAAAQRPVEAPAKRPVEASAAAKRPVEASAAAKRPVEPSAAPKRPVEASAASAAAKRPVEASAAARRPETSGPAKRPETSGKRPETSGPVSRPRFDAGLAATNASSRWWAVPAGVLAVLFVGGTIAAATSADKKTELPPAKPELVGVLDPRGKQAELVGEARDTRDDAKALALLGNAIAVDANGVGARDAYLERAKRLLATGDGAGARADLLVLKHRADSVALDAQVTTLLADADRRIAEAPKKPAPKAAPPPPPPPPPPAPTYIPAPPEPAPAPEAAPPPAAPASHATAHPAPQPTHKSRHR